jgi:S1-C subfamily serine protease
VIEAPPGGAQVYVDDEFAGKASAEGRLKISTLTPGEHRVRLSMEGYRDYEKTVQLAASQSLVLTAALEAAERQTGASSSGKTEGEHRGEAGPGILGVSISNLSPEQAGELAEVLHFTRRHGVLVDQVLAGGFAADLGLRRGDFLLSINHRPVASAEDFNRFQAQLKPGSDVLFLVGRRIRRTVVTLYLADRLR